ncbi:retrovirus-related pol polyprotein LINE-1 [Tanacetum coccineum]
MKLWERVIERRLRRETLVSKNQFGFMPERSSVEAIHLIRSLMKKYRERQRDLHMAFLDLEKAYDSVSRELIWKTLVDKGASRRYIKVIRDMYDGAKTCVRTLVGNTEFFPVDIRLHQGSTISSYLFALILDELSRGIQEDIPCREKTEYLRCDFGNEEIAHSEDVNICIGDKILQPKESFWYLGSMLHKSRRIDEDVYRAQLEADTIINKMREGRLRWFGHVRRRSQSAPVRRVEDLVVDGLRIRGRPKLRWEDRVKQDMKELLLSEDMTSDRIT